MVYGNFTSYAAVRGITPEMVHVSMNMRNGFFNIGRAIKL